MHMSVLHVPHGSFPMRSWHMYMHVCVCPPSLGNLGSRASICRSSRWCPDSCPALPALWVGAHCYAVLVTVHALCLHGMVSWSGHLPSLCVRAVASPLHALCCVCNTLLLRIVGNALALLHFSGVRIHTHVCPPCPTWLIPHTVLACVHARVRVSAVVGESWDLAHRSVDRRACVPIRVLGLGHAGDAPD